MPRTTVKSPASKETKAKPLPQGWVREETTDGLRAVKHFTHSERVAYGQTEQELSDAVFEYERQIASGDLTPT